jgi:hypothetical protein
MPGSPDATAWISAGAAVVQAVGAVAAIWYSGKLARDAAKRERAADEANARRIDEANAAAAEQRRLDREEAERRRVIDEARTFNRPIRLALDLIRQARQEVEDLREQMQRNAAAGELSLYGMGFQGAAYQVLRDRLPELINEAHDAPTSAAIKEAFGVFDQISGARRADRWVQDLDTRLSQIDDVVRDLEDRLHPTS